MENTVFPTLKNSLVPELWSSAVRCGSSWTCLDAEPGCHRGGLGSWELVHPFISKRSSRGGPGDSPAGLGQPCFPGPLKGPGPCQAVELCWRRPSVAGAGGPTWAVNPGRLPGVGAAGTSRQPQDCSSPASLPPPFLPRAPLLPLCSVLSGEESFALCSGRKFVSAVLSRLPAVPESCPERWWLCGGEQKQGALPPAQLTVLAFSASREPASVDRKHRAGGMPPPQREGRVGQAVTGPPAPSKVSTGPPVTLNVGSFGEQQTVQGSQLWS